MAHVTVYTDVGFSGATQEIGAGRYNLFDIFRVGNDRVSSLRVPRGWTVTLYEHGGFQGASLSVTGDVPDLRSVPGLDFNDRTSSIVVSAGTPSGNALTDFDLCVALGQEAINSRIDYAWGPWRSRSGFAGGFRIFKTRRDGRVVDSKTGIEAQLAPLTVNLNVPNGRSGQVEVTLHITSATVTYVDDETAEFAEYSFDEEVDGKHGSLTFVVDLARREVGLAGLDAVDPAARQTAGEIVEKPGLGEEAFSIETLFLTLTSVDLLLTGNRQVGLPADMPESAATRARSCLNFLLQEEMGEFVLGTVLSRKRKDGAPTPTFAMTEFVFDVHGDDAVPEASTLAYLGMVSHRPLPDDVERARAGVEKAWVEPQRLAGGTNSIAGVMAIRKGRFLDEFLIEAFRRAIGRSPTVDGLKWTFQYEKSDGRTQTVGVHREEKWGASYTFSIAVVPDSNRLNVSGRIFSYAHRESWTAGKVIPADRVYLEGQRDLHGEVDLITSGSGSDFRVIPRFTLNWGDVVVTRNQSNDTAKFVAFFDGLAGNTVAEKLGSLQQTLLEDLTRNLRDALSTLDDDFGGLVFIPPGGGSFSFPNVRFSDAGDLLFDVIYR